MSVLIETFRDPLPLLLLQLIVIVVAARLCGALAQKVGQTAVIGEMVAGILLGPSLLGWIWPGLSGFIFPAPSLDNLRLLSQVGICLFMFIVGMELELDHLKGRARTAVVVSNVSILFPFLMGMACALSLFPSYASPNTRLLPFALFLGISLSITAFPVLARILEERGLMKTALGSTAIACAATGDVTAWAALAVVVAVAKAHSLGSVALTLVLVVVFVAFMLLWVKPRMPRWMGNAVIQEGAPGAGIVAGAMVFLFASALVTQIIGIHALFGSFLAGVVMPPHGEFRDFLKVRLEHFTSSFLLPLFFAFIGLRTHLDALGDLSAWLVCAGLILVATLGKLGGATLSARLTGVDWADSFALGALMNTRGLIELVALNIGYDLGILSAPIFTMLVIMALVTTGMTAPLLSLADYLRHRNQSPLAVKRYGSCC